MHGGSFDEGDGSKNKGLKSMPFNAMKRWWKARNPKERLAVGVVSGILALLMLWLVVEDHDNLFVMAEIVHFGGIGVLIYKLVKEKNCAGLSLRSQELTLIFLLVRLYCSLVMEYDIHTLLDMLTALATGWVIYMMYTDTKLRATYNPDLDTIKVYYVAGPCLVVALIAHPTTNHILLHKMMWAFCVYTEAVSVLPQLRTMQKAMVVERFTAHYVFALGVARFLSCAHWLLQIMDGDAFLWNALGSGLWPIMVLLSEIVQTVILADFCYYYVKSFAEGGSVVRLPAGVV
eukprot:CAMPEP_0182877152 /NCGR_PEP_ID=MMETSP0034_2-20130328/14581_1 /TAXON_ID=156128 /ORGANISM="Nephroselmis pyriformis, Strain CCMP717" /LENGTH=288 /DNA_ID=CAMNT_0025009981 /DNA_START=47 /DNA_END=913 /DNA_ORIENTATION=-